MKIAYILICTISLSLLGCGKTEQNEKTKNEKRKTDIMGTGDMPMPKKGDPIPGLD